MSVSRFFVAVAFSLALICSATAYAETADQAFARGHTLLSRGSFQEALRAYSSAARAQRTNRDYVQQFMLVRRVIALRENLNGEKDLERWQQTARALRSFYVGQRIYSEALSLDEQIHARLNTASSATQLAGTQLAMGKNAEALQVLASLGPKKATAATRALHGIALAREGRMGDARKIAQSTAPPEKAGPGTLYALARMHAVVGNRDEALQFLSRCFEAVAPSRLAGFKTHVAQSPEFAALASTGGFAKVLQTKSKVAESKCSGGSSCAGCPMRSKCPKSQGK